MLNILGTPEHQIKRMKVINLTSEPKIILYVCLRWDQVTHTKQHSPTNWIRGITLKETKNCLKG